MKVDIFTISDFAFEAEGKLNVLGTFSHVQTKTVPLAHEGFYVTVKLRFSRAEEGDHHLALKMFDPDRRPFGAALEHRFNLRFKDDNPVNFIHYVGRFKELKFNMVGEYKVDLAVDGLEAAALPLFVRKPGIANATSSAPPLS